MPDHVQESVTSTLVPAVATMSSTIALASKLGVLRCRRFRRASDSDSAALVKVRVQQCFRYLIVIDFESTCWKEKGGAPSEVIEFPAVVLDTTNGEIKEEFHAFVLPTEQPRLSGFCMELTGITQQEVDSGAPIATTLLLFEKWIKGISAKYRMVLNDVVTGFESATFVTWSDWDLNVCLAYECRRKQIRKPVALNSWADLRLIYNRFYERRPNGLRGALQDLGIEFEGREHSGLCDARNTAKLAWKIIQDGCNIVITKCLPNTQLHPKLKDLPISTSTRRVKSATNLRAPSKTLSKTLSVSTLSKPTFKRTPPLCSCGRRAKLLTVSMPGPNTGRTFFACSSRASAGNASLPSRCNFFRWDNGDEDVLVPFKPPAKKLQESRPSSDNCARLSDASKDHVSPELKSASEKQEEREVKSPPVVANRVLATPAEKFDINALKPGVGLQRGQYFGNVALYNNGRSFHVNMSI